MLHEIHKVKSFKIAAPFTLEIVFEDSIHKTFNFPPILKGDIYGPLNNVSYFNKVVLDKEVNTILWPNGADFDPSLLYSWGSYIDELTQCAHQWNS